MTADQSTVARRRGSPSFPDRFFWPGVIVGAVAVLAATSVLVLLPRFGTDVALIDFAVYRWGGMHAWSPDLYRSTVPAVSIPGYVEGDLPFTYTPFAALVFVPFGWLSLAVAQWASLMINLAALAGVAFVSFRAEGVKAGRGLVGVSLLVGCAAALLEPGFQNLMFGQINVVLVLAILWDVLRPSGSTRGQGIAVGLAAAIKLTPAIFILFFLVTGRWRAALRSAITFAVVTGLAAVVSPQASHDYWFGGVFVDSSRVGGVAYVGNQSLGGLVSRVTAASLTSSVAGILAVAIVLACGIGAAAIVDRRRPGSLGAVLITALTGLLVSPISWTHHWIWVVPIAVLLITARMRGRRAATWVLGALLVVLVMPGAIWLVPHGEDREQGWNLVQFVIGNAYVLLTLAAGAALAVAWIRSARAGAPGGGAGADDPGPRDQGEPDRAPAAASSPVRSETDDARERQSQDPSP